jgi:hypothetical protein
MVSTSISTPFSRKNCATTAGPLARQPQVEFGAAPHVRMADQGNPRRPLLPQRDRKLARRRASRKRIP